MPTPSEAFSLAYALSMVGNYFDGAAMLAHVGGNTSDEDLKGLCTEQLQHLAQNASDTRYHIRRVKKAMEAAGLTAPEPPTTPDSYASWVDAVATTYYEALDEAAVGYYLAGWYLGSWILTANLGLISLVLKNESPEDERVGQYIASLQEQLDATKTELPAALSVFAEAAERAVTKIVDKSGSVPPLSDETQDALDVADDYQEALYDLNEAVETLQSKLG